MQASLTMRNTLMLLAAPLIVLLPSHFVTGVWLVQAEGRVATGTRAIVLFILFPLSVLAMVSSGFHPFLYFRF